MPTIPSLRDRITAVWVVLIAATAVSWWLGADHGAGAGGHRIASLVVLLVAFFKLRLVGLYFMELRDAPRPLRTLLEAYSVGVCALVIGMYMTG